MRQSIAIFLTALLLASCTDDGDNNRVPDPGYAFFPAEIGTFVEYRADSIWHDQPDPTIEGIHDTTSYFIREVIESEFEDASGELSLRIERYKRESELSAWSLVDVWSAKRSSQNAERLEENFRYVKMAFPISSLATWDVNALNVRDEWQASYDSLNQSRTIGGLNFANSVFVDQHFFKSLIDDERAYEIYAENVGLILRYERDFTTQIDFINNPVAENIRSGHEFMWEIVDYGKE